MKNTEFRIPRAMFRELHGHLFPGDHDEHGAVIAAGICESGRGTRYLARKLFIARDGVDYVPGKHGYRALSANFVAQVSNYCALNKLCYFAIHCHGGRDSVGFSNVDLESHKRGYPALLDITDGGPVGALVFAENAAAGEIWTRKGVLPLGSVFVVGLNHERLLPAPESTEAVPDEIYNRQSLLFGARGQKILRCAKIGIIGMGGVGSLVSEWLARLGVGEIVAIDFDKIDLSNKSRVVGASKWDAIEILLKSKVTVLRSLGECLRTRKVAIGRRVAKIANPSILYTAVPGDVVDESIALKLKDADFIFLCADTMQSRLVFNALVHQYLIAGVQIGSKVSVDKDSGQISDIFCVSRLVVPEAKGGCLWCNQLISPAKLQEEAVSEEQRKRQAYVDDPLIHAPSVITLNAVAAAQAVNEFMFSLVGLHDEEGSQPGYRMATPRARRWAKVGCASTSSCPQCGENKLSIYARGDRGSLPCRTSK